TLNATNNILTVGIENGNDLTVDLSGLVADGSETIVTGGGINVVTGSGTTLDPYVITATEVDGSITNEVNTAFAVVGSDLSITDSNGTLTVPLSSLGTDDQKIDKFALNGTTLELSAENDGEADKTIDLNTVFGTDTELSDAITASEALDLDKAIGNEVTDATDATLIRSGAGTTVSPYTLDVATGGITTTEILDGTIAPDDIADKAVTLTKLADGTADGQVMQWDDVTSSWTLVDLGSVTVTENDGVIGNEVTNATDGTLVRSGAGTTVSPYTLDVSADGITNAELADNAVRTENILSGGNDQVLVTDATGTVEWVDKSILNSDNQTLGIAGDQLTISGGNTVTVPTADGSETIVTGGGINVVTGSGTTLDPYVITATEVDGSITNEVNTAFAVVGSDLSITDSNGTLTVPLSSLGT
ncbi:hypothetical protein, partial [Arenibacter sp. ARW7G5Y1]|uniref:hypothetical protein n=1 Tax=Arenibacter sp. ARW7G5Y1 TaxID=2135619 RepID=UPI0015E8BED9